MKQVRVLGLFWVLTVVLVASVSYWAGLQELLSKRPVEAMPDVQIVQPLTPLQRQLLETRPVQISEGMIVTVSEPGKPPQHFAGQAMPTQAMPTAEFRGDIIQAKLKLPKYFPKPCRVRDSKGRLVWGICFSCRLDK